MTSLVTGCAGFIGFHTCKRLLSLNHHIIGIDNLNSYYDTDLKHARLAQLTTNPLFNFIKADITTQEQMTSLFQKNHFDTVIHLAAQAGVRHSLSHPEVYTQTNMLGFGNILEACRQHHINHLIFASSGSIY